MNSSKTIKSIENSLTAGNIGTNKYLININGGDALVPTNENSRILYNLPEPYKLEKGDKVTLYQAFLNERGLSDNTISFDEDIENELRFLYYKLGDCEDYMQGSNDVSYAPYPNWQKDVLDASNATQPINGIGTDTNKTGVYKPGYLIPRAMTQTASNVTIRTEGYYSNPLSLDHQRVAGEDLSLNQSDTTNFAGYANMNSGANGKMFYLMEGCRLETDASASAGSSWTKGKFQIQTWNDAVGSGIDFNPPGNYVKGGAIPIMRPVYGKAKIVVKKGNYSVDELADTVMEQLNGSIGEPGSVTQKQSDALIDKLYHPNLSKIGTTSNTIPFFDNVVENRVDTDADITIHDNIFYKNTSTRKNGGIMCELNIPKTAFYDSICYDNMVNAGYTLSGDKGRGGSDNPTFFDKVPPNGFDAAGEPGGGILVKVPFDEANRTSGGGSFRDLHAKTYGLKPGLEHYGDINQSSRGGNHLVNTNTQTSLIGETNNFYISNGFLDTWVTRAGEGKIIDMQLYTSGRYNADGTLHMGEFEPGDTNGFVSAIPIGNNYDTMSQAVDANYIFLEDQMYLRVLFPVYARKKPFVLSSDLSNGEVFTDAPNPDPSTYHTSNCGMAAAGEFRTIYGGTSDFTLKYDSTKASRYSLSNFHDFYKLPSYGPDGNNTGSGGNQATKYNNPFGYRRLVSYPKRPNTAADETALFDKSFANATGAIYPIDGQTGIMINNFAYDLCKNTAVFKKAKEEILAFQDFGDITDGENYGSNAMLREKAIFDLFTKPFDKFFASDVEAREAWSKSLWSRLGFTYDQLGDVTSQLESRKTGGSPLYDRSLKLFGLVTHNQFDFTSIPSSQGLGTQFFPSPDHADNKPKQKYTLQNYYLGKQQNPFTVNQSPFVLLDNSKSIDAAELPNLNDGRSYYIIESDIVKPNYANSVGTKGTVVGIMSKENSTQDTLFSTEGIEFIMTEEKLLTEINIDIKNADGTRVPDEILGVNSGFIFMIEKAISPAEMGMNDF